MSEHDAAISTVSGSESCGSPGDDRNLAISIYSFSKMQFGPGPTVVSYGENEPFSYATNPCHLLTHLCQAGTPLDELPAGACNTSETIINFL